MRTFFDRVENLCLIAGALLFVLLFVAIRNLPNAPELWARLGVAVVLAALCACVALWLERGYVSESFSDPSLKEALESGPYRVIHVIRWDCHYLVWVTEDQRDRVPNHQPRAVVVEQDDLQSVSLAYPDQPETLLVENLKGCHPTYTLKVHQDTLKSFADISPVLLQKSGVPTP